MERKNLFIVVMIFGIVVLMTSIISAGWFESITGEAVSKDFTCGDSDGGIVRGIRGTVTYKNFFGRSSKVKDKCSGRRADFNGESLKKNVKEYYCTKKGKLASVKKNCVNGCRDGACVNGEEKCGDVLISDCVDSRKLASCIVAQGRREAKLSPDVTACISKWNSASRTNEDKNIANNLVSKINDYYNDEATLSEVTYWISKLNLLLDGGGFNCNNADFNCTCV